MDWYFILVFVLYAFFVVLALRAKNSVDETKWLAWAIMILVSSMYDHIMFG